MSTAGWPPPWGLGSTEPVVRWRCNSRVTKDKLTRNRSAISASALLTATGGLDDPLSEISGVGGAIADLLAEIFIQKVRIQVKLAPRNQFMLVQETGGVHATIRAGLWIAWDRIHEPA